MAGKGWRELLPVIGTGGADGCGNAVGVDSGAVGVWSACGRDLVAPARHGKKPHGTR
jgi:hypothetical protein